MSPSWFSRSHRGLLLAVLVVAECSMTSACNQRAIESWLSQSDKSETGSSLYSEANFGRALAELKKRVPSPIEALSLLVYSDRLVLQARDPVARSNVLQYVWRDGRGPDGVPVKLIGTGKLDDNLFPLDAVKLDAVPKLVRDAQAKANIPEGSVARVLLKRNLPESMDIQFRVFVTSQRRDAYFDADQQGNLIE
jgi:hypothetical protein